jgi:isocitrate lyase
VGALTGGQAMQRVKAGIKAIYLSGWQVAADNNSYASMYPDQSLYPVDSVPMVVERINNSFRRADEIQWSKGTIPGDKDYTDYFAPIVADAEAADLITSDYDENDKPFLTGERTAEGFYKTKKGMAQAISRAVAYAEYADLVWCETGTPDLEFARKFAEAVHKKHPGKLLAYNCSPSFNWKKNLDDATIAKFQKELGAMGYKYQFITLAGIHSMWYNMFDLAQAYVQRGMSAYVEKVQEPEFAARDRGYSFVSHQQEVGTGYFDEVTTVIQGGRSSVTALTGSTEEEQFH